MITTNDVNIEELKKDYNEVKSLRKLTKKYGRSHETLRKYLMEAGVEFEYATITKKLEENKNFYIDKYLSGYSLESLMDLAECSNTEPIRKFLKRHSVPMREWRINKEQTVKLYETMHSADIAQEINRTQTSVLNILRRKGVKMRRRKDYSKYRPFTQDMINLRQSGWPKKKIAEKIGCSTHWVNHLLKEANVD